jgi:sodium transport system permease protein
VRARPVAQIAAKEILSTVRDRRAIISNLLVPLFLLPLMMLGLPLALGGLFNREQAAVTPVAVQGLAQLPGDLVGLLEAANLRLQESRDPQAAVSAGSADLGLIVPPDMGARLAAYERVELRLYSKHANLRAQVAASKVAGAVEAYRRGLVSLRLRAAGLDPSLLEPLAVEAIDASSNAERSSGQLSWLIPFFIAIWTLVGGQMTAIDATAGEKERGTLESLLVAPVWRSEVVAGKFLATLLFGLSAALMAIVGYLSGGLVLKTLVGSRLGGAGAEVVALMGGSLQVTPQSVGMLLMSTLLLAATVAALLMGVTLFARSFKEAQSYVAPLSFLLIVPSLVLQFKDLLDLGRAIYLVPVVNVLLLIDDTVKGSAEFGAVALTWASLLLVIAALLTFALHNFNREGVIFRT